MLKSRKYFYTQIFYLIFTSANLISPEMKTNFKKTLLVILTCMFSFILSAQKEGLKYISQQNLRSYMTYFASDELQGRETGTPSNDAAALYISTNLIRLGLKGLPGTQSYFQEIPMQRLSSKSKLSSNNGNTKYSTDSLLLLMSPTQDLETRAAVVFAGYGYVNENTGYNDLKDLDLKGKIVIIMTDNPERVKKGEGKRNVFSNDLDQKLSRVFAGGPKAILIVYNGSSVFNDPYSSGLAEMVGPGGTVSVQGQNIAGIPIHLGYISTHTADILLGPSGNSIASLTEKIKITGKPNSFEVPGEPAQISTIIFRDTFKSRNVIGVIEGSDPVLKNECIIYTAHFDHTGVSDGKINNGADDDASGSMALLETAGAFMQLKKKPLRTIIFVWVNGEEKGLLGSKYYTDNPVLPLDKTLIDINLDMVGRTRMPSDTGTIFGSPLTVTGPGELEYYSKKESRQLESIVQESAEQGGIKLIDKGKDLEFGGSDHMSFWNKGVTAIMLHSGIHADLHTYRDDVEKIDFDKMEKSTRMCFLLGYKLGNMKERFRMDTK